MGSAQFNSGTAHATGHLAMADTAATFFIQKA
jgi:hypothetical protein